MHLSATTSHFLLGILQSHCYRYETLLLFCHYHQANGIPNVALPSQTHGITSECRLGYTGRLFPHFSSALFILPGPPELDRGSSLNLHL